MQLVSDSSRLTSSPHRAVGPTSPWTGGRVVARDGLEDSEKAIIACAYRESNQNFSAVQLRIPVTTPTTLSWLCRRVILISFLRKYTWCPRGKEIQLTQNTYKRQALVARKWNFGFHKIQRNLLTAILSLKKKICVTELFIGVTEKIFRSYFRIFCPYAIHLVAQSHCCNAATTMTRI